MCSNNTSNNVGVRWVANASGVVGVQGDYGSSSSMKAKKKRIPKRGPGVAELEKILREQGKRDGVEKGNLNIGGIPSSIVPSNSLPRKVTYLLNTPSPRNTPLPPPLTTLHVNGSGDPKGSSHLGGENVSGNGRSKGVYISGSGVFLPEKTLLPVTWVSSETRNGPEPPKMATDFSFPSPKLVSNPSDQNMFPPPMLQTNHCTCAHPSMMNLFPGSAISSSSTPSSSLTSAGVYHHVELPSTQKSCHNYTSTILAEEDKIIGTKRSRPDFPVENWPPAPPNMPCQPPPFHPQISRLSPSSSSTNNDVVVFDLGKIFRDSMPSSPLELKAKTFVNDHGNPNGNGNALTKVSPTTSLPSTQNCLPDLSKCIKQFPFQEMEENTEEQRGASATAEATIGLKNEKYYCTEKTADFIDLNLKL